jgi:CheY-like chemotaxis protein
MPVFDGYQIAQCIHAESWGCNVKIVGLSGWAQGKDYQRAFESGFDDYLVKPIKLRCAARQACVIRPVK